MDCKWGSQFISNESGLVIQSKPTSLEFDIHFILAAAFLLLCPHHKTVALEKPWHLLEFKPDFQSSADSAHLRYPSKKFPLLQVANHTCDANKGPLPSHRVKLRAKFSPLPDQLVPCSLGLVKSSQGLNRRDLKKCLGFPGGSDGKESACNAWNPGSIPGLGRSPGEGNGNPLQYPCLENLVDRGAWWTTVYGIAKS